MKLVVLESPTKVKTLTNYLSQDYLVLSSNGHIKELKKTGKYNLGIDLKTFKPKFVLNQSKMKVLTELKKYASKAEKIYLATDPDREGEAISFHLESYFKTKIASKIKIERVIFNEITKSAVLNAFKNPTTLDYNLVESQVTRRILDRMVGFRLSQLLWRKVYAKSAGRVQSVALKLIVDRATEIENFTPQKSWEILALFSAKCQVKLTKRIVSSKKDGLFSFQKVVINEVADLTRIKQHLGKEFIVQKVEKKKQDTQPPEPLKTATLLQLVSSKFGFSAKKTMFLAQQLYEGVEIDGTFKGLITYPRTDSQRINKNFCQKAQKWIEQKYGSSFQGSGVFMPNKKQNKVKIQDAHEAIHVTEDFLELDSAEKNLTPDLYKIYSLIYFYSFAPFMAPAQFEVTKFTLLNHNYVFELACSKIVFPGYLRFFYSKDLDSFNDFHPAWTTKQKVVAQKIIDQAKVSKPKAYFTEGTLIKNLEKIGVGRPSTYNTIVTKLITSQYVKKEKNKIYPNELGVLVDKKLRKHFSELINEKYTYHLEQKLDKIAEGNLDRISFLNEFWPVLEEKIKSASIDMTKENNKELNKPCLRCKEGKLIQKQGRYGQFISCSGYPDCKYIQRSEEKPSVEVPNRKCPKCSKVLLQKQGRYGQFISCSGYPECRYIESGVKTDRKCPTCNKDLVKKQGPFGEFISCSGYPDCRYIERTREKPSVEVPNRKCPKCSKVLLQKQGRYGQFISCSGYPECKYIEKVES